VWSRTDLLGYHPRMPDIIVVLVIILIVVVIMRGPKTLPKLGEAFGRGVKEAKAGAIAAQDEIQNRTTTPDSDETDPPA